MTCLFFKKRKEKKNLCNHFKALQLIKCHGIDKQNPAIKSLQKHKLTWKNKTERFRVEMWKSDHVKLPNKNGCIGN